VFIVLIGASLGTLAEDATGSSSIVIGLLLPPEETDAASLRQGVLLGVEHANEGGGARARVVIRGREGQWGADAVEVARMVTEDGVRGLIAPAGGAPSHLTLQVAGRTAVPVVSLCPDSSVTGTGIPWMVRLAPRTRDEAQAIFAGLPNRQRVTRWAALVPEGRAGHETAEDLTAAAQASGCHLAKPVEVGSHTPDFSAAVWRVLEQRPEALLLWLEPRSAAQLAKELRSAGFAGALAGPSRLRSPEFVHEADSVEGVVVPAPVLDDESATVARRFDAAYAARFQTEPDLTAALAYDAATLLIPGLRRVGLESPHRAFPLTDTLAGASGRLSFDSEGNRTVRLELSVIRGGRWTPVAVQQSMR
jgi:ABC-type branched-subunit amino acid transport system substrate-binding protein